MFASRAINRAVPVSLACLMIVWLLSACGSSGGSKASGGGSTVSNSKVTLVVGNSQWLDPDRGAGLWNAVLEFEKVDPNVTLKQEAVPGSQYNTLITTQLGAGSGPDVLVLQDSLFESLASAGFLVPLPSGVTAGVTLNDTSEGAVFNGQRLGVAWQQAPFGLMYNKALLAKAGVSVPTTPAELIADAQKVHQVTGDIGFGDQSIAVNTGSWVQQIDSWTYGNGGSWEQGGKLTIDTPANVAGVAQFAQVAKAGITQTQGYNNMIAAFTQGQVAMLTDCGCGAIGAAEGGVVPSTDIGVAPEPTPQDIGFDQQLYVSVNKYSKNSAAAEAFVKWMISPAGQDALRIASGPDALATNVAFTPSYAAANPWAPQFAALGTTSLSTLIPGFELQTTQIMQIVVNHIQQVVVSGVSPQAAMTAAQAEVDSQVK